MGQARKKRDNKGEKGDKRREDRSNKRKNGANKIIPAVVVVGSVLVLAFLFVDDGTGVGAADDFLIPVVFEALAENFGKLFA